MNYASRGIFFCLMVVVVRSLQDFVLIDYLLGRQQFLQSFYIFSIYFVKTKLQQIQAVSAEPFLHALQSAFYKALGDAGSKQMRQNNFSPATSLFLIIKQISLHTRLAKLVQLLSILFHFQNGNFRDYCRQLTPGPVPLT